MSTEVEKTGATPSLGRLALVVGVNGASATSTYLAPLQCAERSAVELSEVLQASCNFELFMPPLLGEQATTAALKDAIRKLAWQRTDQDFLLFYFAGHGYPMSDDVEQRNIYLVTHDFDPAMIEDLEDEDAHLSLSWLSKILYKGTKAGRVLLILDCCYGGNMHKLPVDRPLDTMFDAFKQFFSSKQAKGTWRATLAAAGQDAVAWEREGSSVMTGYLLQALCGEDAEAVDDAGDVTLERLQDRLRKKMPFSFSGEITGESLILATHPNLSLQARRKREQAALAAEREHEQATRAAQREERLRTMFSDHSGFMQDRLDSFVGREKELAELRQRIDKLLPTGGYLTITGQPGQGKSSIIAKLIESYGQEQGGLERVAYHFIPLTPGADHQVVLLRKLMARLILKYDLSDLFLASKSRPALSDAFPRVLQEIAAKGGRELIFIDGLDQLEAEHLGHRDLSFLPQGPGNPPTGIVFVLGTRPNDTLRPLELLKPHDPYLLPNLSRADFDLILQHHQVTLEPTLASRFYEMLEENALYLDLVAKELAARGPITSAEVEEIIRQIADNPENLFSLAIDRLSQPQALWQEIVEPVLGLLLVTSEPLTREQLKQLITINAPVKVGSKQLNTGLERLGGLIVTDGQQRYTLFHLKFRDSLRQDRQRPGKKYLFDAEEEQRWHTRFIAWCEKDGLPRIWEDASEPVEQGRRRYARQHYLTHLYHAHMWDKLFRILDEGAYGRAKVQHDPSTRTYALDLDLGRKAAASPDWSLEEGIQHLPRLWRYMLLQCSLASRADEYPVEAFRVMLLLGREPKALGLAELITDLVRKAEVFTLIASHFAAQPGREREADQRFLQAEQVIGSISDEKQRGEALAELAGVLEQAERWQEAERVIGSISDEKRRGEALTELAGALARAGHWQEAEQVIGSLSEEGQRGKALTELAGVMGQAGHWPEAEQVIGSISDEVWRGKALAKLAGALAQAGRLPEAERVIGSISDEWWRGRALTKLAEVLAQAGRLPEAERLWQEAERVIGSISDEWWREKALTKLAEALAQAGRWSAAKRLWQEAEQVIGSISDKWRRGRALTELAEALRQAGRWQEAERLWRKAEWLLGSIPVEEWRGEALTELAEALGQAGRWQEAERVIDSISNEWWREKALTKLAEALGQAGRWHEAERVIDSISNEWWRGRALTELAEALGQAGRWHEAEQLWHKAEQVIGSLSEERQRREALVELASALEKAERRHEAERLWHEAERLLGSIPTEGRRGEALAELAGVLGKAGRWQEAERVIASISEERQRGEALAELAGALGKAGRWHEAERVIASISNEWVRGWALVRLAGLLAQAGRWQVAEQVIGTLSDEGQRGGALTKLAEALAQAGRWREAEQVIGTLSEEGQRGEALTKLAGALAQAGRLPEAERLWQEAEQVISSLSDEWVRGKALTELAEALAQAGRWQEAKRVIGTLSGEVWRGEALTKLAGALAQAGHWLAAERLWQEAEQVIGTLSGEVWRGEALTKLAGALAQAGRLPEAKRLWQEAEQVIGSFYVIDPIPTQMLRGRALTRLAHALAKHNQHGHLLSLVYQWWRQADTRYKAIEVLPLAFSFIPHYPNIGMAFSDAFAWVDNFLQGRT